MNEITVKSGYEKLDAYAGMSIDTAVEALLEYRDAGKKAYVNFNGHVLYSDTVTLDDAYRNITGCSREKYFNEMLKAQKASKRREKSHLKRIPKLIPKWIKKGHKILDEKYWDLWDKCVPIRLGDLYHGKELGATLEIVKKLNKGCSFDEAKNILERQNHTGMSCRLVCFMTAAFCDSGEEFMNEVLWRHYGQTHHHCFNHGESSPSGGGRKSF